MDLQPSRLPDSDAGRGRLTSPQSAGQLRDHHRLLELEAIVERGLTTFVEVGEALTEIRGSGLYRDTDPTFEAYCQRRWKLGTSRVNQLMDAAEVVGLLDDGTSTAVEALPTNERQARELAAVLHREGPEAVKKTWTEAVRVSGGKPTAKVVREVVAQVLEPEEAVEPPALEPAAEPATASLWNALTNIIKLIDELPDPEAIVAVVPTRRQASTARKLRKVGTDLGAIAVRLERLAEPTPEEEQAKREAEEAARPEKARRELEAAKLELERLVALEDAGITPIKNPSSIAAARRRVEQAEDQILFLTRRAEDKARFEARRAQGGQP